MKIFPKQTRIEHLLADIQDLGYYAEQDSDDMISIDVTDHEHLAYGVYNEIAALGYDISLEYVDDGFMWIKVH